MRRLREIAGISRADAVLAVTDDEAVNLEIALVAKDANPSVRVVARVFDHDLASRVERRLQLGATRSVSMLAAPAFAAVALGRRQDVIFPVGRRVLLFTELTVSASSAAPGRSLRQLEEPGASRILAWSRSFRDELAMGTSRSRAGGQRADRGCCDSGRAGPAATRNPGECNGQPSLTNTEAH